MGALLFVGLGCRPQPEEPDVFLIGIDGLDPDLTQRWMAAGRLPNLARLHQEGAYGRLRSREPLLSPLIWTTMVTGRAPQDHGILDFVEVDANGALVPITAARRQVPALWNLADANDLSSGFLGWYATFPAEEVRGFQVSDRIAFHQVQSARADQGVTFPEALSEDLRQELGEAVPDLNATRQRFLDDPGILLTPDGEKRLAQLAEIHATAEFYRRALPWLAQRHRPRLLGVYFELVDACGHLFMENAPPRRSDVTDADFAAFSGTVERCYVYQDEALGEILEIAGPETVILVVSDHGFKSGDLRPRTSGRADTGVAGLWHRLHGVVFVHGRGVLPGATLQNASVLDVPATVLALLGIPLSDELLGRPWSEIFNPQERPEIHEGVRRVERYRWTPSAPDIQPPSDSTLDKLQALGYIDASGGAPAHDADGRTASSYRNEGTSRAVDGDIDGALRAYSRALDLEPQDHEAMVLAARLATQQGKLDEASRLVKRATKIRPNNAFVQLERANLALRRGEWTQAESALGAAEALDDRITQLPLLRAQLANATGDSEKALAELERAESLTDAESLLGEIFLFRARVAAESDRLPEAEEALQKASQWVRDDALAPARGDVALARGAFEDAALAFRQAIANSPRDATLARKLGQALAGQGNLEAAREALRDALTKTVNNSEREGAYGDFALVEQMGGRDGEAITMLTRATRELPRSAALWAYLGAAYGRQGRLVEAQKAYEKAVDLEANALTLKTLAALVFAQDQERAIELWRRSLELKPDQEDVLAFLAAHAP